MGLWGVVGPTPWSPDPDGVHRKRWSYRKLYEFGFTLPGTPDLSSLENRLKAQGLKRGAPVFIRIFKRDFELELWMQRDGLYQRFATYPICGWSGALGPKLTTGDRQAPEGVYTVEAGQLNPDSRWHRAFNLGFPNAFDQSHGRSGSLLMVHGGCSSVGCYAMTNPAIEEIYSLVSAALTAGQKRFQVQVLPFPLSEGNLKAHGGHPSFAFWSDLKAAYDLFERDFLPPRATVCKGHYIFQKAEPGSTGTRPVMVNCPGEKAASR